MNQEFNNPSDLLINTLVDNKDALSFQSLGLCAEILKAVKLQGFEVPTEIQVGAIPAVLAFNVFGRIINRMESDLEGFARDLRELLVNHSVPLQGE